MRATNYKHYGSERKKADKPAKARKGVKIFSIVSATMIVSTALIIPTTTLAPDVNAYEDSRAASLSVGDISEFSSVISENCVELITTPATEAIASTVAKETTQPATEEKTEAATEKETEAENEAEEEKSENNSQTEEAAEEETKSQKSETKETEPEVEEEEDYTPAAQSQALISITNPDYSYTAQYISLSSYDRAKLERLVMGEAGTMGFDGAAVVAQAIRDAMVRSGTSSIDRIISEYQYTGSTYIEPNSDVLNAVSFIFDQNGIAVQHRVLCFYTGSSAWHETQNFIVGIGSVRFFDLTF